jgi:hypothetical protein
MRTEDDLRDALDALADSAPAPADTTVQMPWDLRRVWPRRAAIVAVAAACVTAIALPVGYLATRHDTGPAQPAAGRSTGTLWQQPNFTVDLLPGWRIETREAAIGYTSIGVAQSQVGCDLVGFGPGRFTLDQLAPQGRTPTVVDGKQGFFGTVRPTPALRTRTAAGGQALVWQYAPKAWALSICSGRSAAQTRSLEMTAAQMVRPQQGRLRVPFAVKPWAGVARVSDVTVYKGSDLRSGGGAIARARFGAANNEAGAIALERGVPQLTSGATPIEVGGREAWYYRSGPKLEGVIVLTSVYTVRITLPSSPGTRDALVAMARDLRVAANPADERTWFDAATSLP